MTVMVPMIRTSLVSSVMVASAPFQEHKSAVEAVNANVTTLPNKLHQRLCCFGIFPSGFYGDVCKGVHRPKQTLNCSLGGEFS